MVECLFIFGALTFGLLIAWGIEVIKGRDEEDK